MAKSIEQVTDDVIREGGILSLLYFDVHGTSKEGIKHTLVDFIKKLNGEQGVVYVIGTVKDSIEDEAGYATSAEVRLLTRDFTTLLGIGLRYGPIGVEVIRPHEINLGLADAQNAILTASQTSHEFSTYVVEKLMKDEEKVELNKKLEKRAELGKRLLGGKKDADTTSEG